MTDTIIDAEKKAGEVIALAGADIIKRKEFINTVSIITTSDYDNVNDVLSVVKKCYRALDDRRKSIVDPINIAKKNIQDLFNPALKEYLAIEGILKKKMIEYRLEEERKQREEEQRARKLAEAEEEKKRKALEKRIENAESKGKLDKVEELKEAKEAIFVPPVIPQVARAEKKGDSISYKYIAEVIDKSLVPLEYIDVNVSMLNKIGQATKGAVKIPGIKFNKEPVLSKRC